LAIVAELREGEKRRIIDIGRLIIEPDFKNAEFAVVVHDDYQGKGSGYKLVDMLIGIGQEKRLDKIYGMILTDNRRMLKICEELGFTIENQPEGVSKATLVLK